MVIVMVKGKDKNEDEQDDRDHSVQDDKNTGKGPEDINPDDYK